MALEPVRIGRPEGPPENLAGRTPLLILELNQDPELLVGKTQANNVRSGVGRHGGTITRRSRLSNRVERVAKKESTRSCRMLFDNVELGIILYS